MTGNRDDDPKPDDAPLPWSPASHSLLGRLKAADDQPQAAPAGEHVSPFSTDDLDVALDQLAAGGRPAAEIAQQAEGALEALDEKMVQVARELNEGRINQAQFQAIFTHYAEQRAVIGRLLKRNPNSDAWKRVAVEGHTAFLRKQHAAEVSGVVVFDMWTGSPLKLLGDCLLDGEAMASLMANLQRSPGEQSAEQSSSTQIDGGRWLAYISGAYAATLVVYTSEPSVAQREVQLALHRQFEQTNRQMLEAGQPDPQRLSFPQDALMA